MLILLFEKIKKNAPTGLPRGKRACQEIEPEKGQNYVCMFKVRDVLHPCQVL